MRNRKCCNIAGRARNVRVMARNKQTSQKDSHFNESIVNEEEILKIRKRTVLGSYEVPSDMEQLEGICVMDPGYYLPEHMIMTINTEADVRRALVATNVSRRILKPCFRRQHFHF